MKIELFCREDERSFKPRVVDGSDIYDIGDAVSVVCCGDGEGKRYEGTIYSIHADHFVLSMGDETSGLAIQPDSVISIEYLGAIKPKVDMVSHPPHYQSETGLEVIDVIEAFTFNLKGIEATDTGNVIKYICRWKGKNGVEDLEKAKWYLEHLINHVNNLKKEND